MPITNQPAYSETTAGDNTLLTALSDDARAQLLPRLQTRELTQGTPLWRQGDRIDTVYFPRTGLISLTLPGKDNGGIDVGSVGAESALGLRQALGDDEMRTGAMVQIGGVFATLSAGAFAALAARNEEIAALTVIADDWLLIQAQQIAACNASHSADARFCRWLVLAAERTRRDLIALTQEDIAGMLGIRRTTVTLIAQKLHQAGIISYSRGKIAIRDGEALRANGCTCCAALGRARWPSMRRRPAEDTAPRLSAV